MRVMAATLWLALLASALAGCLDFEEEGEPNNTTEPDADDGNGFQVNVTATATANATTNTTAPPNNTTQQPGTVLEVVMRDPGAGGYSIDPSTLAATQGQHISLRVESHPNNIPGSIHRFVLEGYGLSTQNLQPGESEWLNFTADQPGTFAYWCDVGSHRTLGMEGELTVQ